MFDSRTDHPHKGVHFPRAWRKEGEPLAVRPRLTKAQALAEAMRDLDDLADERAIASDGFDLAEVRRVWRTIEDSWARQAPFTSESGGYRLPILSVSTPHLVAARIDANGRAKGGYTAQPPSYGSLVQVSTRRR